MTNLYGHSIILHSDWSVDPSRGSCIIRRRMLVDPTAVHTNPETLAGHFPSTPRLLSFPPPHQPIYLLAASSLPDLLAARRRAASSLPNRRWHLPPAELAAVHGLPHALLLSPLPFPHPTKPHVHGHILARSRRERGHLQPLASIDPTIHPCP